jgi:uncharacterized membrane protein
VPAPIPRKAGPEPAPGLSLVAAPAPGGRIIALDALRGLALALMALDHCAYFAGINIRAEHSLGRAEQLLPGPHLMVGLLTNVAAPVFWLLSGVSVALVAAKRRSLGESEAAVTGFFLIRAALLLLLDIGVCAFAWGSSDHLVYSYTFDVLTSLGLAMAAMSFLRRAPRVFVGGLGAALLLGYPALLAAVPAPLLRDGGYWAALWISPVSGVEPHVWFPVLGWMPLMLIGFACAPAATRGSLVRGRAPWVAGAALVTAAAALRFFHGYGSLVPFTPAQGWVDLWVMSKDPPGLDFLLLNLGFAAWALGTLGRAGAHLRRAPWSALVVCGQASLFFYVLHLVVYNLLGHWVSVHVPSSSPGLARLAVAWLVGLALMLPLVAAYRRLRQGRFHRVLKYL